MAWKAAGRLTGRPVGSVMPFETTGKRRGCGQCAAKDPEEVGIASPVDPQAVAEELIHKDRDRHAGADDQGEYLERWGCSAKVRAVHAKDQDPEEVRHWLEVTYPAIEERRHRL